MEEKALSGGEVVGEGAHVYEECARKPGARAQTPGGAGSEAGARPEQPEAPPESLTDPGQAQKALCTCCGRAQVLRGTPTRGHAGVGGTEPGDCLSSQSPGPHAPMNGREVGPRACGDGDAVCLQLRQWPPQTPEAG